MKFNIKRYLELKKELTELQYNSKSTGDGWNKEKILENKEKILELNRFHIILNDNIQWETRYNYYKIIHNFVENQSTVDEFFYKISFLDNKNKRRFRNLEKNVTSETIRFFDNESHGFSTIISDIPEIMDLFDPEIIDSESSNYGISENFLKKYLKENILSRLQKYCKK